MRWSRHLLTVMLVLSIPAIALCGFLGGPIWVLLWSPWLVGCVLLRRGHVVGAVALLVSAVALVATIWDGEMQLRLPSSHAFQLLFPSFVAGLGGLTAMMLLRHAFRVDRRTTAVLLLLCFGTGLAGSTTFSSLPKVAPCPRETVVVGPLLHGWYWLNGSRHEGLIDGRHVLWLRDCVGGGPGSCHEGPVDGTGVWFLWRISESEVLDDSLEIHGGNLLRVTGVLESAWQVRDYSTHGWSRRWFDNGRLASVGEQRGSYKEGPWRFWWPNGRRSAVGQYCADRPCEHWRFWDQRGKPLSKKAWLKLQDNPFFFQSVYH